MKIGDDKFHARVQQLLDEGRCVSRSEAKRFVMLRECGEGGEIQAELSDSAHRLEIKQRAGFEINGEK